jgi:excisionase family DNA binding protein
VGEGDVQAGRRGVDRITVQEAARRLGVSEGAVRKRVARGTIPHDKGQDGRVYVHLDTGVDIGQDAGVDPHNSALMSQLREEISYLREENRRKDEIIMQQAVTMRQITAAQEPRESPETVAEEPEGPEEPPFTEEAQEDARPRSWWRRFFGFD